MTASFKSHLTAKEKFIATIGFLSLIVWHYPVIGTAYAQTNGSEKGQVFEIISETQSLNDISQDSQNKNENAAAQQQKAKIDLEVQLVRSYLQSKNSPFANYTEILLAQNDWKTILAVSNSESNMGLHCYKNNCSGIFGNSGLRSYASVTDWMVDFQSLIDKRYKNKTLAQMNGVYVVPRSNNWLQASSTVYDDLTQIEKQVNEQTAALTPTQA